MKIFLLAATAAAALSLTAPEQPRSLKYSPDSARYEFRQSESMDMAGMGKEVKNVFALVGVTISAGSGDTLRVVADLDSSSVSTDGAAAVLLPRGARTVMLALTAGRRADKATDGDVLGSVVEDVLVLLPANGGVGAMVVDTIIEEDEELAALGASSVKTIMTSRIVGDTTVDGEPSWKLDLSGNVLPLSFDTTTATGAMKMTISGKHTGTALFAKRGVLLSAKKSSEMSIKMDMTVMGSSQSLNMDFMSTLEARRLK